MEVKELKIGENYIDDLLGENGLEQIFEIHIERDEKKANYLSKKLEEKLDQMIDNNEYSGVTLTCSSFEVATKIENYLVKYTTKKCLEKMAFTIKFGDEIKEYTEAIIKIDHRLNLVTHTIDEKNKKLRTVLVNAYLEDIADLYAQYGDNLYSKNIRKQVEDNNSVDIEITKTLENYPEEFYFLNNGITINTDQSIEFTLDKNSDSPEHFVKVKNFSIINGAQTTTKVAQLRKQDLNLDFSQVKVLLRINQVFSETNEMSDKITVALNRQKTINRDDIIYAYIRDDKIFENHMEKIINTLGGTNQEIGTLIQLVIAGFHQKPVSATNSAISHVQKDISEYVTKKDYGYFEFLQEGYFLLGENNNIIFENNNTITTEEFYKIIEHMADALNFIFRNKTKKKLPRKYYYIATYMKLNFLDKIQNNSDISTQSIIGQFNMENFKNHIKRVDKILDNTKFKQELGIGANYKFTNFTGVNGEKLLIKLHEGLN